ncbi:2-oxoacid:ferredoxin oxidoreductase subunit beta [Candidatus Parvarchaeota archaeon]|nr:2-oxoacid:ferredoxin oxidoreductase subunit beta [Candidatus Parvarchaeota archaeon]
MATLASFNNTNKIQWCPGCGDFAILLAMKNAIASSGLEPHQVCVSSGVGCGSKLPHYIKTYGFEGLHGRSLPPATAIKLSNHELTVLAVGGDGDGYGIGLGHFLHTCRRNIDITYIVQNNQIYGLTTGQTSPTSEKGTKTRSTPHGVIELPVNPISLAISAGASFVARGFSGDLKHLSELIKLGMAHKGFALIDVFQPCVTYNKVNTFQFFQQRCYKLQDQQGGWDTTDKIGAIAKAEEWGEKIPIGIFYQQKRPTYEDELPQLSKVPLVRQPIDNIDITKLMDEFY